MAIKAKEELSQIKLGAKEVYKSKRRSGDLALTTLPQENFMKWIFHDYDFFSMYLELQKEYKKLFSLDTRLTRPNIKRCLLPYTLACITNAHGRFNSNKSERGVLPNRV